MKPETVTFTSGEATCEGWHFRAKHDGLSGSAGRPVMVMAHGLAGTKDSGLAPFASAFAASGLDVLAFDYRGFGTSGGRPRQTVSLSRQVEDYDAAMRAAAALPGVDARRLVLWGISLAGGHVLRAAAGRADIAAVISVLPMVDGLAAGQHALAAHTKRELLASGSAGVRARLTRLAGRAPAMIPVVARPGRRGALTVDGAYENYLAIAGPSWRNEVSADVGVELAGRTPMSAARDVRCPSLVQIADFDRSAPPHAAEKAAFRARAEVRHYPGDHFDVFEENPWHEPTVRHAVSFLTRKLAPTGSAAQTHTAPH